MRGGHTLKTLLIATGGAGGEGGGEGGGRKDIVFRGQGAAQRRAPSTQKRCWRSLQVVLVHQRILDRSLLGARSVVREVVHLAHRRHGENLGKDPNRETYMVDHNQDHGAAAEHVRDRRERSVGDHRSKR